MSEFEYENPFRFIFSVFISQSDHLVQKFACLSVIDFRVYYPRNFIFGFSINYNWSRNWLFSLRKRVGHGKFKYRHMEDWMNKTHGLWKMEGK